MEIRIEQKRDKAFFKEVVNISAQHRSLIRKPTKKLSNYIDSFVADAVVCGLFF